MIDIVQNLRLADLQVSVLTDENNRLRAEVASLKERYSELEGAANDISEEYSRICKEHASFKEQNALLVVQGQRVYAAADAVVKRWDTPLWKDVRPTAEFIYALRDALTALPQQVKSEDAKDAARYRWLRDGAYSWDASFPLEYPDSLDEIVDAAISAQKA